MKLDVSKYVKALRDTVGTGPVDPGSLHALVLFLFADSSKIDTILGTISPDTDDEEHVLNGIKSELMGYRQRLQLYLDRANYCITNGLGPSCSEAAVNPLLYGRYASAGKLPGGSPLCEPGMDCYDSIPDLATPIRIMNELDELVNFTMENWSEFFQDTAKATVRVLVPAAPPLTDDSLNQIVEAAKKTGDVAGDLIDFAWKTSAPGLLMQLAEDTNAGVFSGPASAFKWALIGGAAALGGLVLYKLK